MSVFWKTVLVSSIHPHGVCVHNLGLACDVSGGGGDDDDELKIPI